MFDFFVLVLFFFVNFFGIFLIFFSMLLRLLLKFTEITTEHQKWPKESQESIKPLFLAEGLQKPRPEAEARPAKCCDVVSAHHLKSQTFN